MPERANIRKVKNFLKFTGGACAPPVRNGLKQAETGPDCLSAADGYLLGAFGVT
jgi:hypothetical protein